MKKEVKKTKAFWLYITLGILLIVASIILLPYWGSIWPECPWKDLGLQMVSYAMAALILIYLFGYLIKKVVSSSGTVQVLTILEFTLLTLIALGLVFSQLQVLNIPDSPSIILGIALYTRGVIEVLRSYYQNKHSTHLYPVGLLILAIVLITLGVFLICTNLVTKLNVLIALIVVLFALGIAAIVYGVLAKPAKKVKQTKKK